MPGLIRGVARTAVIAGTATHVSNNVSRRQSNKWAEQEQQQAPQQQYAEPAPVAAAPAAPAVDPIEQLTQLASLHEKGVLTDEEFAVQKNKILSAT